MGWSLQAKHLIPCCCNRDSLQFDMQHDLVLHKLNFDHLAITLVSGDVVWVGVCGQNICYHAAAFMIPFNLICNMTVYWKRGILTYWPHPLGPSRGWDSGLRSKSTFYMFYIIYCTSVCIWKYWQLTQLLRNLNIWPVTPLRGQGPSVWVKVLFTVMLIYRHWVIMVNSQKLSDNIVFGEMWSFFPI